MTDLRVIINDKLRFHKHTAVATNKAYKMLGNVRQTFKTRDEKTIKTIYSALVRPHLEYNIVI